MSYAAVKSCTLAGVQAVPVTVEVHLAAGLPGMSIVGLPQSAVRESKDRVKAAINHADINFPDKKIIINLAPADVPKQGGRFDLPIALGILLAMRLLPESAFEHLVVVGELGLTGEIRSVTGVLPAAVSFSGTSTVFFVPKSNTAEAMRSNHTRVIASDSLLDAIQLLRKFNQPDVQVPVGGKDALEHCDNTDVEYDVDMCDVVGQHHARRAMEVAAAGSHNTLMVGPPGTGKSMLASRLPTIHPPMTQSEAMETASVLSISQSGFKELQWAVRPFRSPHHTASGVALVGGGSNPKPGEVSLAHNGVLFLDELPEFSRHVLEALREPLETRSVTISRAARQAKFPASVQLIAAMNPCPCGYSGDNEILCRCTPDQVQRYQARISGPFLDRLDIHLTMSRPSKGAWRTTSAGEGSKAIRTRVMLARNFQLERQGVANAQLSVGQLKVYASLNSEVASCLESAVDTLNLSLRSVHRVQRVARTIADLEGCVSIDIEHMAEALSYRGMQ